MFVGIGGGTASGKTYLCRLLAAHAASGELSCIALDSYYRAHYKLSCASRGKLNYDHPDAFDFELLFDHLHELRNGRCVRVPKYDVATHLRIPDAGATVSPAPIVLVEGILALHDTKLRESLDRRIFIKADDALRLTRRVERDTRERGRTAESIREQWDATVHPMHLEYCAPSAVFAERIISTHEVNDEFARRLLEELRASPR